MRTTLVPALMWAAVGCGSSTSPPTATTPAAGTPSQPEPSPPSARFDHVLVHGELYAPGAGAPDGADAIAVRGGRIAKLGRSDELAAQCEAQPACRVHDAGGGFVVPGFHDAHSHPYKGGALAHRLRVEGSSVDAIVEQVRAFAGEHPDRAWIVGRGWDAAGFGDDMPDREDLDRAGVGQPVALTDGDGHIVWTNSAAIEALGIDAGGERTPDPAGGHIARDGGGEPTGLFYEGARELVYGGIPLDDETLARHLLTGERIMLRAGFTAWQGGPVGLRKARAYARLDREGELRQRTFLWAEIDTDEATFRKWLRFGEQLPDDGLVRLGGFKGFVDGVIGARTAVMLEPYADAPDAELPEPRIPQSRLEELVLRANRAGYRVALHAIGDGAVRMALDAFARSERELGAELGPDGGLVNSVEHIESIHPDDVPRFAELGVAASMQPSHMFFSTEARSYYEERLGPERLAHAYPWKDIARVGGMLAFGTDYPVVDADPVEGIFCAVRREYGDGTPFEPHQRIDGTTALDAFTYAPARVAGIERLGRLRRGWKADIVVLARDPRDGGARNLEQAPARFVMVRGQPVSPQPRP